MSCQTAQLLLASSALSGSSTWECVLRARVAGQGRAGQNHLLGQAGPGQGPSLSTPRSVPLAAGAAANSNAPVLAVLAACSGPGRAGCRRPAQLHETNGKGEKLSSLGAFCLLLPYARRRGGAGRGEAAGRGRAAFALLCRGMPRMMFRCKITANRTKTADSSANLVFGLDRC